MSKIFTARLPDEMIDKVREIAEKEQLDNSAVVRRLLASAIKDWHLKRVLKELNDHEISIGQAAELLNVNLWDMIELAGKHNINWTGYDEDDLERDLAILKNDK